MIHKVSIFRILILAFSLVLFAGCGGSGSGAEDGTGIDNGVGNSDDTDKGPEELHAIRASEVEALLVDIQADVAADDLSGIWVGYTNSTGSYERPGQLDAGIYSYNLEQFDYVVLNDNGGSIEIAGCPRFDGPEGGYIDGNQSFTRNNQTLINEKKTISILSNKKMKSAQVIDTNGGIGTASHYVGERFTWWFKISDDVSANVGEVKLNNSDATNFDCLLIRNKEEDALSGVFLGRNTVEVSLRGELSHSPTFYIFSSVDTVSGEISAQNISASVAGVLLPAYPNIDKILFDLSSPLSQTAAASYHNTSDIDIINIGILNTNRDQDEIDAINRASEIKKQLAELQDQATEDSLTGIWVAYADSTGTYEVENSEDAGTYHYEYLDYFKVTDNGDTIDTVGCHRFDGPNGGYFDGVQSFTKQYQTLTNEKVKLAILDNKQIQATEFIDVTASSSTTVHYFGRRYTWWFKISDDTEQPIGEVSFNGVAASTFDCLLVEKEEKRVTDGIFLGEIFPSTSIRGEVSGSVGSSVSVARDVFPLGTTIARNVSGSMSGFDVMGTVDDYNLEIDISNVLFYESVFTDLNTLDKDTIGITVLGD